MSDNDKLDRILDELKALGGLPAAVAAIDARLHRVETAVGIGEAGTQPLSGRVDRILAELVEFKAETRRAFTETRNEAREGLVSESRTMSARLAEIEERLTTLESRQP